MSRIYKRICTECGTAFEAKFTGARYCCAECKHKGKLKQMEAYRRKKAEENRNIVEVKTKSLAEENEDALNAGMSYGHYKAFQFQNKIVRKW